MTEPMLLWAFGLLAAATLIFAIELFVPSGGIISIVGLVVLAASIVCFWRVDVWWGMASLLAVIVLGPLAISFAFKIWPHTPVGQKLMLAGDEERAAEMREERQKQEAIRQTLIGVEGEAMTDMHPIGSVSIEGERLEALAEGGMIPRGARVRVTHVEGNRIRVRRVV